MLAKFCNFRKTKAYEWITTIAVIIMAWLTYFLLQVLFQDTPYQIRQQMSHHRALMATQTINGPNPSMTYTYLLNKDGTLTVHRLSDRKNFIVKLDKGEK